MSTMARSRSRDRDRDRRRSRSPKNRKRSRSRSPKRKRDRSRERSRKSRSRSPKPASPMDGKRRYANQIYVPHEDLKMSSRNQKPRGPMDTFGGVLGRAGCMAIRQCTGIYEPSAACFCCNANSETGSFSRVCCRRTTSRCRSALTAAGGRSRLPTCRPGIVSTLRPIGLRRSRAPPPGLMGTLIRPLGPRLTTLIYFYGLADCGGWCKLQYNLRVSRTDGSMRAVAGVASCVCFLRALAPKQVPGSAVSRRPRRAFFSSVYCIFYSLFL